MEIKTLSSLISELGFPIVASLFLGIILYKLGSYLLKMANSLFGSQQKERLEAINRIKSETINAIETLQSELDEESRDTRQEVSEIKVMVIRLIDRIRLLSQEVYDLDSASRIYFGHPEKKPRLKTVVERREDLKDQLNELNPKNGDH